MEKHEAGGRVRLSVEVYEAHLSPLAQRSGASRGRERDEEPCTLRTPYQRDRDRIVHSKAFRRLKHKTQVFISPEGDHYRTRLTHTVEVSGIARTVARALGLNEDLTEAISLGHDLGHTPFGHAGEEALDAVLRGHGQPGFRHNRQSLRVVDVVENDGRGLNLTWEVRDGILRHTGGERPATLEGRIVRICDRVAYINHDIDDALRAGLIGEDDLPAAPLELLGRTGSERIDRLVHDLVDESDEAGDIVQSPDVGGAMDVLRTFLFQTVYARSLVGSGGERIAPLIRGLFGHFLAHPAELPTLWEEPVTEAAPAIDAAASPPGRLLVAVTDYVAGMTDPFAQRLYSELGGEPPTPGPAGSGSC